MFRSLGWPEIALILVIILVIFGVGKLPQVGSAIGKGLRAFKKAQQGDGEDDEDAKAAAAKNSTEKKA